MSTFLQEILSSFKPNYKSVRVHLRATINNYRQCSEYTYKKQLEITIKNLVKLGYDEERVKQIITEEEIK